MPPLGNDKATARATSANTSSGQGKSFTGATSSHAPPARTACDRDDHQPGHDGGHENAERWLLTYADLITLLMVFFVIVAFFVIFAS